MDVNVNQLILDQFKKIGIGLAASLPDDWVSPLIRLIEADTSIKHVPVGREAEAIAVATGAFFGGVKSIAVMGNTGLLTCTGELATINLRHAIPCFVVSSLRGTIEDHQVYQEVQGRRTFPLLEVYDYPYYVVDTIDKIEHIPDVYMHSRLQKRPYILFLHRRLLLGGKK
jgi:sulfopyruvate decarboxylase subunit alpha